MEPVLVCGSKRTSLMDYILAFRIFHAFFNSKNFIGLKAEEGTRIPNEPRILLSQGYADAKPVILYMMREVWWDSSLTLRQVLTSSRQLKSTDPRDKIYGILSMVSEAYHITPDYRASMTPNRLFLLATIRSILVDDSLDILSDGQETNRSYSSQRALPSWVPDFSVFNRRNRQFQQYLLKRRSSRCFALHWTQSRLHLLSIRTSWGPRQFFDLAGFP